MKKNKIIFLIIVILVIIGIFLGIGKLFGKKNGQDKRLTKIYEELNSKQTYLFEMEKNNDNKTIMAQKGDKTIIDQYSDGNRTTTLVKDNNTYLILHNRKEYYVYGQNNVEQNRLTEGIKEIADKELTFGNEKIKDKKYNYEEYNGKTMFIVNNSLDIDEAEVKTRFYFDKNDDLVYIKTLYGEKQELLKVKLNTNVEDSIFEIPSDYAEN